MQFIGNMEATPQGSQRSQKSNSSRNLQKMDYLSTKSGMGAALNSLSQPVSNGSNHYVPNGTSHVRQPAKIAQTEDYSNEENIMDIRL